MRQTNTGRLVCPNGAEARSATVAGRHAADVGFGGVVLASSAFCSRRADGAEGACEDEAVEDVGLGVLVTVAVGCVVVERDERDDPQPAAPATPRTTAPTAAQRRRRLTAVPSVPFGGAAAPPATVDKSVWIAGEC